MQLGLGLEQRMERLEPRLVVLQALLLVLLLNMDDRLARKVQSPSIEAGAFAAPAFNAAGG